MMNMIELQDKLKNFSQDQLVSMMQQPTGEAPQFMVLSEITRRQKMQKEAESQQAPTQSVAQEAVTAAGVPQGGIADMARSLAPQTNVAQNTGVNPAAPPQGMPMPSAPQGPAPMAAAPQGIARMASGGVIKMQAAGKIDFARYRELARRLVSDGSFSPEELKELEQIQNTNAFDNALAIEADLDFSRRLRLANSESLSDINPALPRVESSAPTPVFDATVEAPSLNQAPAADAGAMKGNDFLYGDRLSSRPTYDSAAPQMPVPPKTDSMRQGPRPSGTQVNIAGNIYTVLGDGSVIDQTGRTPPPPVAELARQKAGTPAAQFTTQQQYQDAQNLANRIGANSGENAVLPSEKLLMGGGREGTPYLNTPAADTAIYAGGYDPRTNVPAAPSGLAALSPETMPTVGGPAAPPPRPEFIPWDTTGKNQENFGRFGQYEAGMDYLLSKARDVISDPNLLESLSEPYNSEAEAGLAARKATRENAQQASVDKLKGIVDQLADPNLDPNLRRALEVQLATERALVGFGQGIDAVPEFLTKYGAAPVTRAAATAVSPFSPTTGANMYNFADTLTNSAEQPRTLTPAELERESIYSSLDAVETPASVTPNIDNITDEELAKYTNKRPQPRPKDLFAPTTDNAREGGGSGTGTGSGTGSGSGGMSDYETELMKIMKSREKAAESDKWLALAQVGMGLMQGGSGSFLGDVGAAGMKGLETLRTSRDQADTDKLSLLKAREDARIDRARIAASAAKGSAYDVNDYVKLLADLATQKQTIMADLSTTSAEKELAIKDITNEEARIRALMFGRASPTPKPLYDATKPPERGLLGRTWDAITS
jgi:hypothetical protein